METFSALLAFCEGYPPVIGGIPSQRPVTQSFDVFFDLYINKRLSNQSKRLWYVTPSRSLWRHCNGGHLVFKWAGMTWLRITSLEVQAMTTGWHALLNSLIKYIAHFMYIATKHSNTDNKTFQYTTHCKISIKWSPWWTPPISIITALIDYGVKFYKRCLKGVDKGVHLTPGPRLNIKTVLSTYGDFHDKDKTAVRTSYL